MMKMVDQAQAVLEDVYKERLMQRGRWGDVEHDRMWTPFDWHEMIADYNAWARRKWAMGDLAGARERYVQVAALAIAAIEVLDTYLSGNQSTKLYWGR